MGLLVYCPVEIYNILTRQNHEREVQWGEEEVQEDESILEKKSAIWRNGKMRNYYYYNIFTMQQRQDEQPTYRLHEQRPVESASSEIVAHSARLSCSICLKFGHIFIASQSQQSLVSCAGDFLGELSPPPLRQHMQII
ncbi:unnamed protein product [Ceratitis capitata]|uniref:(Mediterranean fruit fly) hypothetical protein n=1 Tax=Ceratitis capitata TaxID=7213 RepID=A0A811VF91_CERCA|nr:unnamed protein product [Ceratitis capitata]